MPRKRAFAEVEASDVAQPSTEMSLITRLRNTWEFANIMQYIHMFGKTVKIDEDFDIEDFENECMRPGYSEKLEEIGLQLLKFISWQRGLTLDVFDQHTRRQWEQKLPNTPHPYGEDEEPHRFRDFDIFTKLKVLHALTVMTFHSPVKMRDAITDLTKEGEQADVWRINVFGWDDEADDEDALREYYLLDDNRLYRRTPPPPPPAPKTRPKANTLKARAARRRASKKRKLEDSDVESEAPEDDDVSHIDDPAHTGEKAPDNSFAGYKWECIAVTLDDYNQFIASLRTSPKSQYPNERALRERLIEDVLPTIEQAAEKQRRKQERREKELAMMERMAGAKRSSRVAGRLEREKQEQEEAEAARKRAADLAAAHREQERREKMEHERQSRMMTREQRIKDREYKRILMEEELARSADEQRAIDAGVKRGSQRHVRDRIAQRRRELDELNEEDDWTFDCAGCGLYGKNFDDGEHSVACEKCNVWQHSKCLGISQVEAEQDDFHLVCQDCQRKEEEANRPKIMLKFGPGSSPPQPTHHAAVAESTITVHVPSANGPGQSVPSGRPPSFDGTSLARQPPTGGHEPSPVQHATEQQQSTTRPALQQAPLPPLSHQAPAGHVLNGQAHHSSSPAQSTPHSPVSYGTRPNPEPVRLPSPVINRPTMSPTQGNHDVGPIAGVPNSSPQQLHAALFAPPLNGTATPPAPQTNGMHRLPSRSGPPSSPPVQRLSQTPQPHQMSGLSPVKQRVHSPRPPPSGVAEKNGLSGAVPPHPHSPSQSFARSVSGTPIFPPVQKLAPSPEMLSREPVPTPSKQPLPGEMNETPQPSFASSYGPGVPTPSAAPRGFTVDGSSTNDQR